MCTGHVRNQKTFLHSKSYTTISTHSRVSIENISFNPILFREISKHVQTTVLHCIALCSNTFNKGLNKIPNNTAWPLYLKHITKITFNSTVLKALMERFLYKATSLQLSLPFSVSKFRSSTRLQADYIHFKTFCAVTGEKLKFRETFPWLPSVVNKSRGYHERISIHSVLVVLATKCCHSMRSSLCGKQLLNAFIQTTLRCHYCQFNVQY